MQGIAWTGEITLSDEQPGHHVGNRVGATISHMSVIAANGQAEDGAASRSGQRPGMRPTDIKNPDYFHKVVDCQWACPAHTPVPEYIRLDRRRALRRRLHGQLALERLSGRARPHLRPPLRAGVPPRTRGRDGQVRSAGRDLPPEARCRRQQGRHQEPPARRRDEEERQADRAHRRRSGVADRRPRSPAARLSLRALRFGRRRGRHDAHADPEIPPARDRARRGGRLHPRS